MSTAAHVPLAAAALCTAFAGFTAFALAKDRHWEDSFGRGSAPGRARDWLRAAGVLGLLLSLLASLGLLRSSAQGWVLWFGVMTLAALGAVLVLTYAPRRAPNAGLVSAVVGAAGAVVALLPG